VSEKTYIKGKDCNLEQSIDTMQAKLNMLDMAVTISESLNPVPFVYSVHLKNSNSNLIFTNGKGASEKSSLASALGEYFERLSCNYFFADYYLGEKIANDSFVHYPNEKWFTFDEGELAQDIEGLLDEKLWNYFDADHELLASQIVDTNSGALHRGVCALPFIEQSSMQEVYFPVR